MKRLLILFALIAVGSLLYAGGGAEGAEAKKPVTIRLVTYWNSADSFTQYYDEVAAAMEKEFPHLTLNNEGYESSAARDKYAIEFASGSPPDLSYLVQSLAREFSNQGLLLNQYPFITKDPEWKAYYTDGVWSGFAPGGEMYMAPHGTNFGSMMYNKRVLAKAGLSGPAEDWEKMMTYVAKIKATGASPWLTGGKEYRWAWLITQMMIRTAGADKMQELAVGDEKTGWDKPENGAIRTLELLDELVKAGAFPKDINALPRQVGYGIFAKDGGGMWYEGSWMINSFTKASGDPNFDKEHLMIAPFPKIAGTKGDQVGGVSGPLGLAVSSKISGEHQRLALELVKRLSSPKIHTRWLEAVSHPSMSRVINPDWSKVSPRLKEQLEYYNTLKVVVGPGDTFWVPPVDNALKKIAAPAIMDGTMTPNQAAEEVNRRAKTFFNP